MTSSTNGTLPSIKVWHSVDDAKQVISRAAERIAANSTITAIAKSLLAALKDIHPANEHRVCAVEVYSLFYLAQQGIQLYSIEKIALNPNSSETQKIDTIGKLLAVAIAHQHDSNASFLMAQTFNALFEIQEVDQLHLSPDHLTSATLAGKFLLPSLGTSNDPQKVHGVILPKHAFIFHDFLHAATDPRLRFIADHAVWNYVETTVSNGALFTSPALLGSAEVQHAKLIEELTPFLVSKATFFQSTYLEALETFNGLKNLSERLGAFLVFHEFPPLLHPDHYTTDQFVKEFTEGVKILGQLFRGALPSTINNKIPPKVLHDFFLQDTDRTFKNTGSQTTDFFIENHIQMGQKIDLTSIISNEAQMHENDLLSKNLNSLATKLIASFSSIHASNLAPFVQKERYLEFYHTPFGITIGDQGRDGKLYGLRINLPTRAFAFNYLSEYFSLFKEAGISLREGAETLEGDDINRTLNYEKYTKFLKTFEDEVSALGVAFINAHQLEKSSRENLARFLSRQK